MWSLAAFAIAAILYLAGRKNGRVSSSLWTAILAIVLLGLVPIVGSLYVQLNKDRLDAEREKSKREIASVYRVRVTVLDPDKTPVDDAKVWSSMGGEPKKVGGGWQFDIPAVSKPVDGRLTVYARVENTALIGQTTFQLTSDFSPNSMIILSRNESAIVRGIVLDGVGRAIEGVRVTVVGYGAEGTMTKADGGFVLPAHVANGQTVRLHAEKPGYTTINQDQPTGGIPATLILSPRRP
jgi:hypothetical protein